MFWSFIKLATAFYLKMPWQRAVPQISSILAKIAFICYPLDHNNICQFTLDFKFKNIFKKTDLLISSSHPISQVCELTLMFNKIIYGNKREVKTNKQTKSPVLTQLLRSKQGHQHWFLSSHLSNYWQEKIKPSFITNRTIKKKKVEYKGSKAYRQ